MQFKNTLALCAAVLAAVAEGRIAFTTLPSSVQAGNSVKLSWEGSDGSPVTITLKKGEANNLQTVALITGSATGNSYTWTPSKSLENGSNYALQIAQDDTDVNYTGLFSISGGSSGGSSSSASQSATVSASGSPSASSNVTVTTTTGPIGTVPPSAGITGTGNVSRNTTLSRATLSRSASSSESTSEATTTSGEGSGSETSSTARSSPTGAAVTIASNFGLLLAGFAAVVYLG